MEEERELLKLVLPEYQEVANILLEIIKLKAEKKVIEEMRDNGHN